MMRNGFTSIRKIILPSQVDVGVKVVWEDAWEGKE